MPEVPGATRQQARHPRQDHPQHAPAAPLPSPQNRQAGGGKGRQQQGGLEQQHGAGHQARQQGPSTGAWPIAQFNQRQPQHSHGRELAAIQHGQASVTGDRQQGEQDGAGGHGTGPIAWAQPPLQKTPQWHHQGREHRWNQSDCEVRRQCGATRTESNGGRDQEVQPGRFVEVGISPERGQERSFAKALTEFQGDPRHRGLIKIPQGKVAEPKQGQPDGHRAEQQKKPPGRRFGRGYGAHQCPRS